MKISQRGIDDLIKPSEGYLAKQPDGSCKAYRCPAGVWTCGWGSTEGVTANTHWTVIEAEAALRRELATHEQAIDKLVKVPLDQGQEDALVSLSYNIGPGAIAKSDLLKHLNAGDYARAASHFADFKSARVQGDTAIRMKVKPGTRVVLPGLVTRRALEASFFLEGHAVWDAMPQAVEAPRMKFDVKAAATKIAGPALATGAAATKAIGDTFSNGVPAVPEMASRSLDNVGAWKTFAHALGEIGRDLMFVTHMTGKLFPYVAVAAVAGAVLAFLKLRGGSAS